MKPEIILPLLLGCPMLGALLFYFWRGKAQDYLAILLPAGYLGLGLLAIFGGRADFPLQANLAELRWFGDAGLLPLRLDALSSILLIVVLVIGLLVMAFSIPYMGPKNRDHPVLNREGNPRYYFFLSLFIGSMVGVALAGNLLVLFFFWEVTTLCSWALISHHTGRPVAVKAGFKALIMTYVGGVFFMAAIAVVYSLTGSFAFSAIKDLAAGPQAVVFVFLLIAALAKSAQFPLFTWLPDAMEAPTPISAYLHAAAMVKAGVYLMARIIIDTGTFPTWSGGLLAGFAIVTMIVGLIFYFYQDDLKRFLAYSTIAQLGYIMLGLSLYMLGSKTGYLAGVFHIACHAAAKALLFLCVGFMAMRLGVKSISKISGLYQKMPVVSVCFFIGLLAVTGIPPFSCFWSKLMLVIGMLEVKGVAGPLIALPFFLEIVVAFLWFLKVGQRVLFGEPSEAVAAIEHDRTARGTVFVNGILVTLVLLTLLMPLIAYPFLEAI
jgi:hydrogenase-4 component D